MNLSEEVENYLKENNLKVLKEFQNNYEYGVFEVFKRGFGINKQSLVLKFTFEEDFNYGENRLHPKSLIKEMDVLKKVNEKYGLPKFIDFKEFEDGHILLKTKVKANHIQELNSDMFSNLKTLVLRLHNLGISNFDLGINNILVDGNLNVFLFDFDTCVLKEKNEDFFNEGVETDLSFFN